MTMIALQNWKAQNRQAILTRRVNSLHQMAKMSVAAKFKAYQAKTKDLDRQGGDEDHRSDDTGRVVSANNRLWEVKTGVHVSHGVLRPGMDKLVCEPIRAQCQKRGHRKFVRFVELMMEAEPTPPVNLNKEKEKMKGYAAKAKAAASTTEVDQSWEQVRPVDEISESDLSVDFKVTHLEEEVVYMRQESKQLNTRMIAMENTMNEIVQHLRKMQVKTED